MRHSRGQETSLLAKEEIKVGYAQHPHTGASAKRSSQAAPDSNTSLAPLCSILPLPQPGDAQALGSLSDASPAPASKGRALHPCSNGGKVAAGLPRWSTPVCPMLQPAPPSYSLSISGSEELSTTRNGSEGTKTKPQSLEGGLFSKPRKISQQASAQHLLGHLFQ